MSLIHRRCTLTSHHLIDPDQQEHDTTVH